jgi:hypothetical protein
MIDFERTQRGLAALVCATLALAAAPGLASAALTFAPAANFAANAGPASVAVGDFNGDGRLDLAVANLI